MNYSKILLIFLATLIIHCTYGQNNFQTGTLPKIKAKIDSLYPHADDIRRINKNVNYPEIQFICRCAETPVYMNITFDTNASILNKEYIMLPIKDLPETIVTIIRKDTSLKFMKNFNKSVSNKGDIIYSVSVYKKAEYDKYYYIYKYTGSGELISKEKRIVFRYD